MISVCKLSQSAVSQHLKKLRESGLVVAHKDGKEVLYSLKYPIAADISALLSDLERRII